MLSLSLAQGQVFRKQQKTRISSNNDVVTGNTARDQSKNKVSNQKNGKMVMAPCMTNANIEPFSQQNSLNGNNNDNYTPVSKKDIASDDARIRLTNKNEKEQTQNTPEDKEKAKESSKNKVKQE